ncbi:MAG: SpoIIE family protein phosphatase [Velocimicrobium sp.]
MNIKVEASYKSLNKHHEELCGDKVEILETESSYIIILADGMGSGVKANILATLTSKILGTMFLNGATLDECVQTIVKTLPVCKERQVAYSTFSILQIFHNGEGYLVEFDNPSCIFIRDNKCIEMPFEHRIIQGKEIKESRFQVRLNDTFVLMSDGVIHAGVGKILNFGWLWENVANYAVEVVEKAPTATRLANTISQACDDLYMKNPGDDTTVAVAKIMERKVVTLFTGPPLSQVDDNRIMRLLMKNQGKKIVCGGTSANIAARYLNKEVHTTLEYIDPEIPPIGYIDGIDLVTEGVRTLSRTLTMLKRYEKEDIDVDFFKELDQQDGGSLVAKALIEDCTDLNLLVGKTINVAHQSPELPFDISIRMNLIEQMREVMTKLGKKVTLTYF